MSIDLPASAKTRTLLLSLGAAASAIAASSAADAQIVVTTLNDKLNINGASAAGSLTYTLPSGAVLVTQAYESHSQLINIAFKSNSSSRTSKNAYFKAKYLNQNGTLIL